MAGQRVQFGPGRGIPELDYLIRPARGQQLAVRTEGNGIYAPQVAVAHERDFLAGEFPDFYSLVHACREHILAVRAEGNGSDPIFVAAETAQLRLVLQIPNFHQAIAAAGGDIAAVQAERDGAERSAVAGEGERIRGRFVDIPDLDDPVNSARRQPAAVGAEGQPAHGAAMAAERRQLFLGRQIPELDG